MICSFEECNRALMCVFCIYNYVPVTGGPKNLLLDIYNLQIRVSNTCKFIQGNDTKEFPLMLFY